MTRNEKFNEFFEQVGGLFLPGVTPIWYKAEYTFYHKHILQVLDVVFKASLNKEGAIKPTVAFGFLNSPDLNAYAAKAPDEGNNKVYYIGLNTGCVYLLERLFYTLLANPKVFSDVGDASKEQMQGGFDEIIFSNVENFTQNGNSLDYPLPQDEIRKVAARLLTLFALVFLSLHELTHILDGHLGLLANQRNIRLIEERRISEQQRAEYLFSQTIEFDADSIGGCHTANFALSLFDTNDALPKEFHPLLADRGILLGFASFAVFSVFRLFSDSDSSDRPLREALYPSFQCRRKVLNLTMIAQIVKHMEEGRLNAEEGYHIGSMIAEGATHAEAAFLQITPFDARTEPTITDQLRSGIIFSSAEDEHMAMLASNFQKIRPALEEFAYTTLYKGDMYKGDS
ncbi:MAG: hypothetical protein M3Y54_19705 [Bacteroidota bacterium]|nr:hypothetical protein [Bacteroidota bacterium]